MCLVSAHAATDVLQCGHATRPLPPCCAHSDDPRAASMRQHRSLRARKKLHCRKGGQAEAGAAEASGILALPSSSEGRPSRSRSRSVGAAGSSATSGASMLARAASALPRKRRAHQRVRELRVRSALLLLSPCQACRRSVGWSAAQCWRAVTGLTGAASTKKRIRYNFSENCVIVLCCRKPSRRFTEIGE